MPTSTPSRRPGDRGRAAGLGPRSRAARRSLTVEALAATAAVALLAGTLAAVAGFGGAVLLLPVLVCSFGIHDAVPILTVGQLIGNGARAWFNRDELAFPVVGWFALGALPLALLGAVVFAAAPSPFLRRLLGAFLIVTVAYRHSRFSGHRPPLRAFALIGAGFGFLSSLVGSVGPLMAPFFLAYGLVKGAYIGTEAFATVTMRVASLFGYGSSALLTESTLLIGAMVGVVLVVGAYIGKRILDRVPERAFPVLIELVLIPSGAQFLILG